MKSWGRKFFTTFWKVMYGQVKHDWNWSENCELVQSFCSISGRLLGIIIRNVVVQPSWPRTSCRTLFTQCLCFLHFVHHTLYWWVSTAEQVPSTTYKSSAWLNRTREVRVRPPPRVTPLSVAHITNRSPISIYGVDRWQIMRNKMRLSYPSIYTHETYECFFF